MQDTNVVDPLPDSAFSRRTMVDRQIKTFDVTDAALLARMLEVPREAFFAGAFHAFGLFRRLFASVPGGARREAKNPIGAARSGAPYSRRQGACERQSARCRCWKPAIRPRFLSGLAHEVVAVESDPALFEQTRANLNAFGLTYVRTILAPLGGRRAE